MKSPSQFKWSALVALTAIGVMGIVGACGDDGGTNPPPPPPPPPIAAPTNLTATVVSETQVDLTWTDNASTETGFKIESCTGTGCTTFTQLATVAANVTTYSATGLIADTIYAFRVSAFATADTSTFSNTATARTEVEGPPPTSPVLIGAGEITSCGSIGAINTARIVDSVLAADVNAEAFTVGNNISGVTGTPDLETCFTPTWGAFKARTHFALGQGDYEAVGKDALYGYFGDRVGPPNGWYSFDRGEWHIVVLNTSTWQHGVSNLTGTPEPSPMLAWLAEDLATTTKPCIMAISWQRRFYSGTTETYENSNMRTITRMLTEVGADVLVSANDRVYSRFALQDFEGNASPAGIRQFIVGTGGRSLANTAGLVNPPTLEVRDASVHGVLKLTLNADNYSWQFIPTVAGGFTDSGTQSCH